jgi:hypothetical protein
MTDVKIRLIICLLLAITATTAFGQSNLVLPASSTANTTVLPLWNSSNGQIDALLLIEPSVMPQLPSQRIIKPANAGRAAAPENSLQLRAGLSLEANPGMGVLCNSGSLITSVGSLAGQCMLVNLGHQNSVQLPGKTAVNGLLQAQRSNTLVTGSVGVGRETLSAGSAWINESAADRRLLDSLLGSGTATLDTHNASLIGQVSLGTQSWVSIGGTLARVRLIPTNQILGGLPPEWDTASLSLGGGIGNFGGEITGQMIEVPGQSSSYSTLGVGVSWRTPWKAKLSVGADNLVTRGKSPFGLPEAAADTNSEEGRVPYVRYQQDL